MSRLSKPLRVNTRNNLLKLHNRSVAQPDAHREVAASVALIGQAMCPTYHRGDLSLEAITAQDEAAVGRVAQRGNRSRRDLISEQALVACAACVVILAPFKIEWMCRDHRIGDAERLAAVIRPGGLPGPTPCAPEPGLSSM